MTTTLAAQPPGPGPDELLAHWILEGSRATYTLHDDERVAAEGTAGVLGPVAVFDNVETSTTHRRRGLGRHVMGALTTWAFAQGATTGMLAASADGAGLYTSLGWKPVLDMWSLMGVADD